MNKKRFLSFKFNHRIRHLPLSDTKQTWWQLASIQIPLATSIPVIFMMGIFLSSTYGIYNALLSILVGNVILMLINLVVVLMSFSKRQSILDLARDYLGYYGGMLVGATLVFAVLSWIPIQLHLAYSELLETTIVKDFVCEEKCIVNPPVIIGIVVTIIACFGIKGIKWFSILAMPFVLFFLLSVFFHLDFSIHETAFSLSLSGVPIVIGTTLTGTIDMPTFFRHSKSLRHAISGICIYQIVIFLAEIMGVFLANSQNNLTSQKLIDQLNYLSPYFIALVIVLTTINVNMTNIYRGSVGWEVWVPKLVGKQEYFILGLGGIAIYQLINSIDFFNHVIEVCDIILGSLAGVLTSCYIFTRVKTHVAKGSELLVHFIFWMIGIAIGLSVQMGYNVFFLPSIIAALFGSFFSLSFFLYIKNIRRKWCNNRCR